VLNLRLTGAFLHHNNHLNSLENRLRTRSPRLNPGDQKHLLLLIGHRLFAISEGAD
jgi:hypothetical protein